MAAEKPCPVRRRRGGASPCGGWQARRMTLLRDWRGSVAQGGRPSPCHSGILAVRRLPQLAVTAVAALGATRASGCRLEHNRASLQRSVGCAATGRPRGSERRGGLGVRLGTARSPDSAPPLPKLQGSRSEISSERPCVDLGSSCMHQESHGIGGQFWVIVAAES